MFEINKGFIYDRKGVMETDVPVLIRGLHSRLFIRGSVSLEIIVAREYNL